MLLWAFGIVPNAGVYVKVLAKVQVKRIIDAFQDLTVIDAHSASKLQCKLH